MNQPVERIVSAAIETGGGLLIGSDHNWIIRNYAENLLGNHYRFGFTTSKGRFVDRVEAKTIAENAGQLKGPCARELRSQDLKEI